MASSRWTPHTHGHSSSSRIASPRVRMKTSLATRSRACSSDVVRELSADEAGAALRRAVSHAGAVQGYRAFYSSLLGGVTRSLEHMTIPIDEHMAHRGHAVFDTTNIHAAGLWGFDAHLDRLYSSAAMARITPRHSRAQLREIALEVVRLSGVHEGSLRFWLTAGPGNFALGPSSCTQAAYIIALEHPVHDHGTVTVVSSSVPPKPHPYCVMKSTNYLQNCHALMEAEDQGADFGVFFEGGVVAEGPNLNIALIDAEGYFVTPPFDKALRGVTLIRMMELIEEKLWKGPSAGSNIVGVKQRDISLEDVRAAREAMVFSSGYFANAITAWDGVPINGGEAGPASKELEQILLADMQTGSAFLTPKLK